MVTKCEGTVPVSVRVDFTANGEIIPLGITDKNGKTYIIDKIDKINITQVEKNINEMQFYCKSSAKWFWLYFVKNVWYL